MDRLQPYKYRIVFERGRYAGSAIHTFYASSQKTADGYARDWARRRKATKLIRIRKESRK